jgi:hypothetical protein
MEPSQSERGSTGSTGLSITTPPELDRPLVPKLEIEPKPSPAGQDEKGPAGPSSAPPADYAKFAEEVHNYIREYIRNADQKATAFFAAATAMLAFLNTQNVASHWIKDVRQWTFTDFLGFLSMFGLGIAAAVFLAVVFPRLKGSRRGILFFFAIAEHDSSTEYADEVIRRSGDDLLRAKLQHDYDLSQICARKYRTLRVGFWIGSVGICAALLYLFLTRASGSV